MAGGQDVWCTLALIIKRGYLLQLWPGWWWHYLPAYLLSPWPGPVPHDVRVRGMFPISLLPGRWKHVNWTSLTDNLIPDNFLYDSAFRVPAILEPYTYFPCLLAKWLLMPFIGQRMCHDPHIGWWYHPQLVNIVSGQVLVKVECVK